MAESERYLPLLIDKVETICEETGLRNDEIVMRMTGCPNGCARPYAAEVRHHAFVEPLTMLRSRSSAKRRVSMSCCSAVGFTVND